MKELIDNIVAMNEKEAVTITDRMIEAGEDPMKLLDAYRRALAEVGKLFEKEEYFLPELILGGKMMKAAAEKLKPLLKQSTSGGEKRDRVLIGTVEGDIHDIGKNIVTLLLDVAGFEIMDIGVDVPAQKFVEAAKDFRPKVIGLSCLLSVAYEPMKMTVEALEKEGLRNGVKILIGGAAVDTQIRDYVRADAFGKDAVEAVTLCKLWTERNN